MFEWWSYGESCIHTDTQWLGMEVTKPRVVLTNNTMVM